MGGGMAQLAALLMTGLKQPCVEHSLCEPASNKAERSFYQLLLQKMNEGGMVGELPLQLGGLHMSVNRVSADNGVLASGVSNDNSGNVSPEYLFQCLFSEDTDPGDTQLIPAQETPAIATENLEHAIIRLMSPEQTSTPKTEEAAGIKISAAQGDSFTKTSSVIVNSFVPKVSSSAPVSSPTMTCSGASALPTNPSLFSSDDKLLETQLFSPSARPEVMSMDRPGIILPVLSESLENAIGDNLLKNHSPAENPLPVTPPVESAQQPVPVAPIQPVPALDADVLVDQMVQGVRIAHTTDGAEMHVQLKPEFLGKLSIKISSDIHGLHMEIKAENESVRQIMQDTLPNLQQRLAEKGIVLNNVTLLADSNWTGRRRPEKALTVNPSGANFGRESKMTTVPEIKMPARFSLIDYFA